MTTNTTTTATAAAFTTTRRSLTPPPAFESTRDLPTCASPKCHKPVPARRLKYRAIYCSSNCSRVGVYWRKTEEERQEINKRSNQYRFREKLLPRLQSISKAKELPIPPGHPVAQWIVQRFLLEGYSDWRWGLALNFLQAREALAHLAGGFDKLDQIETALEQKAAELCAQGQAA